MRLENYLLKIAYPDKDRGENEQIYLHDINSIIKEIYLEMKKNFRKKSLIKFISCELKCYISTFTSWLRGWNPIPVLKLYKLLQLWKEICDKSKDEFNEKWDEIFEKSHEFSAWGSPKVTLPKELNEEIAYLCGFITGDGYIKDEFYLKKQGKNCEYSISMYDSSKRFIDFLTFLFIKNFRANTTCYYNRRYNMFILRCTSKPVYRFFTQVIKMQRGKDTGNIKIPSLIKNSCENIKLAFIRGFFDAEGAMGVTEKNPWLEIAQISDSEDPPYILRWMKNILKEKGIQLNGPQLMSCDRKAWRLRTASKKNILKFYEVVSTWYLDKFLKLYNLKSG